MSAQKGSIIGPSILSIINGSLHSGMVPLSLKHAVVQPLLKKQNLDHSVLSNFRKLFLANCRVFGTKMLCLRFFSPVLKPYHSTESALLKVLNSPPVVKHVIP